MWLGYMLSVVYLNGFDLYTRTVDVYLVYVYMCLTTGIVYIRTIYKRAEKSVCELVIN